MEKHENQKQEGEEEPDIEEKKQQQAWGTWEELLLACAVNRHGFKDWDAVAMEVQARTTTRLLANARHCEQKFHDLSRRFHGGAPHPRQNGGGGGAPGDDSDHVPWLEELRKLRVAELRSEVQRRDVSIMSLQLEVKRLEEEKKAKENDGKIDEKPDLAVSGEVRLENDKTGGEIEEAGEANSEPEERTENADKSLPTTTGEESDRENQSVNESNSTGSRFDKTVAKAGTGPIPVLSGSKEPNPVALKLLEVESNNGSYDALTKVPTSESGLPSEERKEEDDDDDDSSELHDSVAHSGEGGKRESSDVQSSASLTRKRKTRRRREVSGGDVCGGTSSPPENDDVAMVKSEPLVSVLDLIKGHDHSSLFERRLESQQDSDRYKDLVKQPLDLETIQLRLQRGHYSSCSSAFFRDLLLLFTNAIVFFPHDSKESQAGRQLHNLVTAEMKKHDQTQSDPIHRQNDSVPPNAPLAKPDSLLSKNKASGPILVCRKRSSMSVKPSSATFGPKGDRPIFNDKKERPPFDAKTTIKPSSSDTDEEEVLKAKEKPVTGARSLRRSSSKNLNNKKLSSNSVTKAGSSGNKPSETLKPEKSKSEAAPDKKRNAAADFLKRIKQNTSAEASKGGSGGGGCGGGIGGGGSSSSSKGGGGAKEQKKVVNNGKGDKGKQRASRPNIGGGSGSGDKRNKNVENNSQSKRSVGRPPKKAAETNAGSAKRGRESSASASKDKRPKKRSKK